MRFTLLPGHLRLKIAIISSSYFFPSSYPFFTTSPSLLASPLSSRCSLSFSCSETNIMDFLIFVSLLWCISFNCFVLRKTLKRNALKYLFNLQITEFRPCFPTSARTPLAPNLASSQLQTIIHPEIYLLPLARILNTLPTLSAFILLPDSFSPCLPLGSFDSLLSIQTGHRSFA